MRLKLIGPAIPDADPVKSARAAGLRYTNDDEPGITRVRAGKSFRYLDSRGRPVRHPGALRRIKALVIPPAWQHVWICPDARGHLQATGRDARRRKQFRYHPQWRAVRDANKYEHILAFAQVLPTLRARIDKDLALPDLPRAKVLAAIVRLLERTLIRVGNEEYARHNGSYGLTTLLANHVSIAGTKLRFRFRGKSGIQHTVAVRGPRLARIVRRCQDLPGQKLFQYLDERGRRHSINSSDVNAYLKEITGLDITAKDFRTWAGTVLAASALADCASCASGAGARRNVVRAIDTVAERLGNSRAICKKCYIHPQIIDAYLDGTLHRRFKKYLATKCRAIPALGAEEAALLAFFEQRPLSPGSQNRAGA